MALPKNTSAQKRVEVKGSANSFLVSDKGLWGLETDRMYVLPLVYKSITPVYAKYFIVENKSSRMGICNAKGRFIFPCQYAKISVNTGVVELYEETGEDPKYFHISDPHTQLYPPAKQVTPTKPTSGVTAHELEKETTKGRINRVIATGLIPQLHKTNQNMGGLNALFGVEVLIFEMWMGILHLRFVQNWAVNIA